MYQIVNVVREERHVGRWVQYSYFLDLNVYVASWARPTGTLWPQSHGPLDENGGFWRD